MSHSFAAARQVNVLGWKASLGHVLLLPVHVSATSHPPEAAARQVVPALPGWWTQIGLPTVPLQRSVVQTLPSSVHAVPDAFTVSFGQVELGPVQSSALSHALAAARHVVPELPGACTHAGAPEVPLQRSVVQTLPSSVHAVPDTFTVSPGQVALLPGHVSWRSHSFAAARQTNVDDWKASLGHVLLLPVHVSATSQPPPAAARHVVPELPGACWQTLLAPLQRSVVQTLPSSVQAVPFVLNVHVVVQHEPAGPLFTPSSHDSGLSTTPSPQSE